MYFCVLCNLFNFDHDTNLPFCILKLFSILSDFTSLSLIENFFAMLDLEQILSVKPLTAQSEEAPFNVEFEKAKEWFRTTVECKIG